MVFAADARGVQAIPPLDAFGMAIAVRLGLRDPVEVGPADGIAVAEKSPSRFPVANP